MTQARPKTAISNPMDKTALRKLIADKVTRNALSMVDAAIESVKEGNYLPMKYLFELIDLFPANDVEENAGDDSLVNILLQRLGLPEGTPDGSSAQNAPTR